jgi:hypothetical protein
VAAANQSTWRKTFPHATSTVLELNPGLCGEKPASNHLRYGTDHTTIGTIDSDVTNHLICLMFIIFKTLHYKISLVKYYEP